MENIKCGVCKTSYSSNQFHKDSSRANGYCRRCKYCDAKRVQQRAEGRLRDRKELVRRFKDKPCSDCCQVFPYYVLDFDHREGEEKLFNISNWQSHGLIALIDEIQKCDVVCANCHRIRTWGRSLLAPVVSKDDD